jgi:acyl-coenzyme A synthetase/AMP-(fatty) acid ligase
LTVAQVVVVGVPHGVKGEVPVAAVVCEPGVQVNEETLLAWTRQHIAPFKAPRRIIFLDAIPQNFAMKVKRREVREQVLAELEKAISSQHAARQNHMNTFLAER